MGKVGACIGDLRVEAFELGSQGIDLLALALQIGACLVDLGAGHVAFCRECGNPLFGHETRLAQGLCAVEVQP
ncbi:hypothetical protein D3C79_904340 [compost metagenome]